MENGKLRVNDGIVRMDGEKWKMENGKLRVNDGIVRMDGEK